MQEVSQELRAEIETAVVSLLALTDATAENRTADDKWSKKEILGHLIDSASNNHQRFVRVQLTDGLSLPGYEQNAWVEIQSYETEAWETLVALWRAYNLHLAHLIAHIPEENLAQRVTIGENEPVTLEFLIRDYVRHLQHHLGQIFENA